MILILLGAPGAGKGTQAEALATATGAAHIATGDLFRAEIAAGSALGLEAKSFIDAGKLVPDAVTIGMITARLAEPDARDRVILDGFPRNVAQAEALDAALVHSGRNTAAILLEVDRDALVARISGRRICSGCGRSYHLTKNPPKHEGTCDTCGGALTMRSDDAPETVAARMSNQLAALDAVIAFYRASSRLQVVDGEGEIGEVGVRLARAAAVVGLHA